MVMGVTCINHNATRLHFVQILYVTMMQIDLHLPIRTQAILCTTQ
jgi:hypothetical protein